MNNSLFILLCTVVLMAACGDKKNNLADDNDNVARCLMAKDYKYEELLTKADVSKHVSIDESSFKMEISPTKGKYGSCDYRWDSDRPDMEIEILGYNVPVPDHNQVVIKMLDFYSDAQLKLYQQEDAIALFEQSYKRLSQSEYDELLANLEKAYANDPSGFETAKGFLDARMTFRYEPIDNLGTRAYWKWHDEYGIELVVLSGAARFTIETKLSADAAPSLDLAVKFAREVLAKCGG